MLMRQIQTSPYLKGKVYEEESWDEDIAGAEHNNNNVIVVLAPWALFPTCADQDVMWNY